MSALDPSLVLLHRAAARLRLVEAGDMTVEEAIGGLIEAFREIAPGITCRCECSIVQRWERDDPPSRRRLRGGA
jgi:hypothetical protein